MKKYQKESPEKKFIDEEFQKKYNDEIGQIYDQSIVRSFEKNENPLDQLESDKEDIIIWLMLCREVESIEDAVKITFCAYKKLNEQVEKIVESQEMK